MASQHNIGHHDQHYAATMLCIDDDAAIVKLLAAIFGGDGHEVIEATNGQAALDILPSITPDIIICDIEMPEMNGLQFLENLRREHHELDDIPFIFMSARSDNRDIIAGLELGADDYLRKPFDAAYLKAKAYAYLRQVSRMTEKKEHEHMKIYKAMARKLEMADVKTFEAYDILLERLDDEYTQRLALKDKIERLTVELQSAGRENMSLLGKLSQMKLSLEISLDRLKVVRGQVKEAKVALSAHGEDVNGIREQLDTISKTADCIIYPAASII